MSRALLLTLLLILPTARAAPEPSRFTLVAEAAPEETSTRFSVSGAHVDAPASATPRFSIPASGTKGLADCAAADDSIFRNGFEN
jgi:hypothetical protein